MSEVSTFSVARSGPSPGFGSLFASRARGPKQRGDDCSDAGHGNGCEEATGAFAESHALMIVQSFGTAAPKQAL